MKIELTIDGSQLGETVLDVFKTLTQEQKQGIAAEVLREWLKDPSAIEDSVRRQQLIEKVREEKQRKDHYGWQRDWSDAAMVATDEFKREWNRGHHTKADMVNEVTRQVSEYYKTEIEKCIKEDSDILRLKESVYATVKETLTANFHKYVHDAVVAWVCQHFQDMANGIASALMMNSQNQDVLTQLRQKLLPNGY